MEMQTIGITDDSPPGADTRYGYQSPFQLWTLMPMDMSIEKLVWINFAPIAPLIDGCMLEFLIMSNSVMYIDLANMLIYCVLRVVHEDGTSLAEDEEVSIINYIVATMWRSVDLYAQQQIISTSGANYAYKAMFEVLLESDYGDQEGFLKQGLFYKDEAGAMDSTNLFTSGANSAFCSRNDFIKGSRPFEVLGRLHVDLARQDRYLMSGIQVNLKLTQNPDSFRIMAAPGIDGRVRNYKLQIQQCYLKAPMIKPTPGVLLGHADALLNAPAMYPFERTEIKTIAIPRGMSSYPMDNLCLTSHPKRLLFALVCSDAYNGDYTKNPFNFKHYNTNYLCLQIDGACFPTQALQPNYPNGIYLESYNTLFSIAPDQRIGKPRKTTTITRDEYPNGYTMYLFNFDGGTQGSDYVSQRIFGLNKMDLKFGENLTENITVVIYNTYNCMMRVDEARNIKVEG